MSNRTSNRHVILACAWLLGAGALSAADPWHLPQASVRFRVQIEEPPRPLSAGCLVTLPDGGLLPGRSPGISVLDDGGRPLESGCLWYDPDQGMLLVFAPPASGTGVWVYAQAARQVKPWSPATGLTPGTLAFMRYQGRGLEDARALARDFPPGRGTFYSQVAGLSLGALPYGLDDAFADYVLGFTAGRAPGRTWIAPQVERGAVLEIAVAGRTLEPRRASDKPAGEGAWFDLPAAPTRIEMFGFRPAKHARMQTAWRPPGTTPKELGADAEHPDGRYAARSVLADEVTVSGRARLTLAQLRDGAPAAIGALTPESYFWFADRPVVLYRLAVDKAGNPPDTAYAWTPAPGATLAGDNAQARWIYGGLAEHTVALTAASGRKSTTAAYTLFAFCPPQNKSDINSTTACDRWLATLLAMFASYPAEADPTAGWSDDMWDLFWRLLEPGRARTLVVQIVTRHWEILRKRLSPERLHILEDLFLETSAPIDPEKTLVWLDRFARDERDAARRGELELRRAEIQLYDLENPAAARHTVTALQNDPTDIGVRAVIRLGDIAFLGGDLNQATALYGQAQDRYRKLQKNPAAQPSAGRPLTRLARSREDFKQQREARQRGATGRTREEQDATLGDWRVEAVRDTAVSETTRSLIDQGYDAEAAARLDAWELEFPMSKLTGDFTIVEAMLLIKRGEYRRADKLLKSYCDGVDMTTFLVDAMRLRRTCMTALKAPEAERKAFLEQIRKRFPYHPVAREAAALLDAMQPDTGDREATKDTL